MFELSLAFKYLLPRWRQLSVSIISLISVMVIALVVWLIVVFFSVTHGLENTWVNKLIALTAPVRVTPTEEYYKSYYYLIDSISQDADFTTRTIGEKLASHTTDPYDPDYDQAIPGFWKSPDLNENGEVKDIVKLAFSGIERTQGAIGREYEMTITNLKLKLNREEPLVLSGDPDRDHDQTVLTQATYLTSFDPLNPTLPKTMYPVSQADVNNLLRTADVNGETTPKQMRQKLKEIFSSIKPNTFIIQDNGLQINTQSLPLDCEFEVCVLKSANNVVTVFIPENSDSIEDLSIASNSSAATLTNRKGKLSLSIYDGSPEPIEASTQFLLMGNSIKANGQLNAASLESAESHHDVTFDVKLKIQGVELATKAGLNQLNIDQFSITNSTDNFWLFANTLPESLPSYTEWGEAVLLPKSWRESGALIGDRGFLTYQTPTASSVQEQRVPVYVAGFFDPGILPMGGRILLANTSIVSMIRAANPMDDTPLSNGINIRINDLDKAELVKANIEKAFVKSGIDKYWKVETFREFEFTKDFLQQLRSERNLFTLISMVIIIVACSNIVSMLIILVNDKKMEIGILRSMGATSQSIAAIFGFCGVVMGLIGSLIGICLAVITLHNLQVLIDFISSVQGFEMFNPTFFGDTLPNEVSYEALGFVLGATVLISLVAGIVPAVKASLLRPSAILRSE